MQIHFCALNRVGTRDIRSVVRVFRDICGSGDSSVDIVIRLRTGQPSNRGSIPGRKKGLIYSAELSDWLWDPPS
jgi:hypothetical protein